jgi:hypothetical protein
VLAAPFLQRSDVRRAPARCARPPARSRGVLRLDCEHDLGRPGHHRDLIALLDPRSSSASTVIRDSWPGIGGQGGRRGALARPVPHSCRDAPDVCGPSLGRLPLTPKGPEIDVVGEACSMPLPQLRNHAIPWSFGRSTLRPTSAVRMECPDCLLASGPWEPDRSPWAEHGERGARRCAPLHEQCPSSID